MIIGASSGIGKGVAEKLGSYHSNVVLAARRTELLEKIADSIRSAGGKALVVGTDVTDSAQLHRLVDLSVKEFGKVDVWINNAGVGNIGKFWEIPLEVQSRVVDINLKGVIYGSHIAVNLFRKQGYGTIINTGSVDSETPQSIKVVTIMPWATDTPWWRHAANYSGGTARMALMDGPEKSVNAIIRKSVRPKRNRVPVGWKARENAPPDSITTGSVFEPMKSGQEVDDGVRARIKKEKKVKKD